MTKVTDATRSGGAPFSDPMAGAGPHRPAE
jgi:hypothetical protein